MNRLSVVVILLGGAVAIAAPTSKATLSFGAPTVTGALDAKAVGAVVKRSSTKLLACYKTALAKLPELAGTATATFTIGADGKVSATEVTGLTEAAAACIAATIGKLRFAKPKDGAPAAVTYELTYDRGYQVGAFASLTGTGDISSGFDDTAVYGGLIGDANGTGGLGPSGGGGTGLGTLGTGRYGTIGHGSGLGSGFGVGGGGSGRGGMRGRAAAVPTISLGQPTVTGDLDKALIRRYLKRQIQKLQYCYEKELLAKQALQGTVTTTFTIGATGLVTASQASGVDPQVETCMAAVIKAIEFPKPKTAGEVAVSVAFTLRNPAAVAPAPAAVAPAPKK